VSRQPLQIRLGSRWTFFAYARKNATMLGTVQDGLEIGALVQMEDGSYAQVNGDVVRVLNATRVEHALRRAKALAQERSLVAEYYAAPPATPPTVIIKKRRRISSI